MKRTMRIMLMMLLVATLAVSLFAAGKSEEAKPARKVINLWSFTDEVPKMIEKYKALHPEFDYEVKTTIIATTDGAYQPALDQALAGGGDNAPDMYCAEAAFVLKYTQGDAAHFAAPYKDLGINVDAKLKEADIAPYTVDIGTNGSGDLVGLGYQATGGAFIYRRSIAKAVWGTDDPAFVTSKVGPAGTSSSRPPRIWRERAIPSSVVTGISGMPSRAAPRRGGSLMTSSSSTRPARRSST